MSVVGKLRHLRRYREIASAFVRNGFGYVAKDLGLTDMLFRRIDGGKGSARTRSVGERLRLFLEELGPTFVKLGQIASVRSDLIPATIIAQLELLQDHVPPFPYEEAARIIEEELGAPIDEWFDDFGSEPVASASIGQVYLARLKDGTEVAVKVQRPKIAANMKTDLDILTELTKAAEKRLEWARLYKLRDMIEELADALWRELDYEKEARNAERFAIYAAKSEQVRIPAVFWPYSTKKVLTMEYINGIKLSDFGALEEAGLDRKKLAERFAGAIFEQVLTDGFFHGDPHPGNVLALRDGKIAFLDFGMVGRLQQERKRHFISFVIALRNQSTNGVIRAIAGMGFITDDTDREALRADVDELREKYYKVPLSQVSMGETVNDLFDLAMRHRIQVPAELTLLGKTFLTMEGVVTHLDANFSVFDVAEPFGKKLLLERLNPLLTAKKWLEELPELAAFATDAPRNARKLWTFLRKGKLGLEITVPELGELLRKMDQISNRLSLSIVLLSFSIIMVGLIIGSSLQHQRTVLWNIPAIEIGFGIAAALFLWLTYAIFRSGRF
ncbi:ABC1 kinase family protein [Paenibacillus sp. NPDC058071]|uniref:ABC1 kinase family protein n=1 Tax=Paenibacillus sp. NPDC058071 TaxID=3346326 RepID=UPI0036DF3DB0